MKYRATTTIAMSPPIVAVITTIVCGELEDVDAIAAVVCWISGAAVGPAESAETKRKISEVVQIGVTHPGKSELR